MKHLEKTPYKTQIVRENEKEGISIEQMIRQAIADKTPIEGGSPDIFTPMKDGVLPQYDPRTDKWEIAQEAKTKHDKSDSVKVDNNPSTETDSETNKTE